MVLAFLERESSQLLNNLCVFGCEGCLQWGKKERERERERKREEV